VVVFICVVLCFSVDHRFESSDTEDREDGMIHRSTQNDTEAERIQNRTSVLQTFHSFVRREDSQPQMPSLQPCAFEPLRFCLNRVLRNANFQFLFAPRRFLTTDDTDDTDGIEDVIRRFLISLQLSVPLVSSVVKFLWLRLCRPAPSGVKSPLVAALPCCALDG
jgi:hypothetical protein